MSYAAKPLRRRTDVHNPTLAGRGRRHRGRLAAGTTAPAGAATVATLTNGTLTVYGDSLGNPITVSRNPGGQIFVNGGAIAVTGGTPTVVNVSLIQVYGLGGNDVIALDEAGGSLPRANVFAGGNDDTVTGGSGGDQLFGQAGNDTLLGKGGFDILFGGGDADTLTGGDADDQVFGEDGDDRMVWIPGDNTDLNEGGPGTDTVEVSAGNGAEQFTATAVGVRVRLDRVTPAPFSIDIGTSEQLRLNANGGDDTAHLGAGDDRLQWDPGDGSDVLEGDAGSDTMAFNGSSANEAMNVSSAGDRVRFTRDVANVAMDLGGVESIIAQALGGDDVVSASELHGAVLRLTADAGDGNDVLVGGESDDALRGDLGDDVLLGGLGDDTLDGGPEDDVAFDTLGANTVTAAILVAAEWVKDHSRPVRGGGIVLDLGGRQIALPPAELAKLGS